jgi:hypothetical protein
VAQPEPGLEPDRTSLERPEYIAEQQHSPSNLADFERICREEYRCVKHGASYPRGLEAVITAKGAKTKYRLKGLNT